MARNFVATEWTETVIKSPSDCHLVPFVETEETVLTATALVSAGNRKARPAV
jgi:hypothetical protein